MFRVATALVLLLITFAFMEVAQADQSPIFNVHTDNIEASAGWQGAGAQVQFTATDYATTNLAENLPPPHQTSSALSVCVELPTRTICSNSSLLDAQFEASGSLDSAVVQAVVPAQECLRVAPFTCSDANLHIDLTWTAIGPLSHDRFHNKIFSPEPCHINELGIIARRQAQVSGSITDGTVDFITGLNTAYAEILRFQSATTGRGAGDFCL